MQIVIREPVVSMCKLIRNTTDYPNIEVIHYFSYKALVETKKNMQFHHKTMYEIMQKEHTLMMTYLNDLLEEFSDKEHNEDKITMFLNYMEGEESELKLGKLGGLLFRAEYIINNYSDIINNNKLCLTEKRLRSGKTY